MSKDNITDIIKKMGYKIISPTTSINIPESLKTKKNQEYQELIFDNNFENCVSQNVPTRLSFYCKTTEDFRTIDSIIRIGFRNDHLIDIRSPDEGINIFKWLKNVNEYLKQYGYVGEFNGDGHNNKDEQNFRYKETTCFNEEFKRLLLNFKNAYTHNYNHQILWQNNNHKE